MKTLKEVKREYILKVLRTTGWDIKRASEILKVNERYLRREIERISRDEKMFQELKDFFKKP
ncbi:MAG: helix-turn-helix domain-containing protein [Desulfobacterota bacterium]|nr:helix-turn-helix domain-containing protein [Thermodesulfobacteriota bacterium]MDW8001988.1 helix-turn-helix domain-containing protein [Deltaproteobacteria bacterium]